MKKILLFFIIVFFSLPITQVLADFNSAKNNWDEGDKEFAYREFVFLAEAGDPDAQYELGHIYRTGLKNRWNVNEDVKKDKSKSNHWFKLAIEGYTLEPNKGDGYRYDRLGWLYQNGYGTEKNLDKAKQYYLKAIENQYNDSYSGLLSLSLLPEEEAKYIFECVEKQSGFCMMRLGRLYIFGIGVEENVYNAKSWFRQSCDAGYSHGCASLAELYHTPILFYNNASDMMLELLRKEFSPIKAMYWYYRSFESGDTSRSLWGMDVLTQEFKYEGFYDMVDTLPISSWEKSSFRNKIKKYNKKMQKYRNMSNQELMDEFNKLLIDSE